MKSLVKLFCVFGMLVFSGCATMSNSEKTLTEMAVAGVIGGIVGSATTPDGENPAAHAVLWAGVAASVTGVTGILINNNDKEMIEKEKVIVALRKEIAVSNGDDLSTTNQTNTTLESDLPEEYRKLVEPGKWQIYKMNQWISEGDNVLVHKDKMIRVVPPQLKIKTSQNP